MRVSVLINSKAGSVNAELIESKVREALFRCDLRFCRPSTMNEMCDFLQEEREKRTDYIIICGGDGTINVALQCLMTCQQELPIPPIVVVRSGTANDLAHEIGVSHHIDKAVRNIFEGVLKNIDVIEVSSGDQKAYMLTNGGLGMPAVAADLANKFRANLRAIAGQPKSAQTFEFIVKKSYHYIKKMGPAVYSMMTAEAIRTWKQDGWELEISIPGKVSVETQSPIILINNQQSIGASFLPAPYTSNTDGTVNLLLSETKNIVDHTRAALHIRRGTVDKFPAFKSFELKEFKMKSLNPNRSLTFFGDGEILHRNVQELSVRCIHNGLPIMVRQ